MTKLDPALPWFVVLESRQDWRGETVSTLWLEWDAKLGRYRLVRRCPDSQEYGLGGCHCHTHPVQGTIALLDIDEAMDLARDSF